uniref:Uncharacterized protein n=1 Tax=Anguilla anguilla TaxID=7936 RepID=A0A0E9XHE4_ANGAN
MKWLFMSMSKIKILPFFFNTYQTHVRIFYAYNSRLPISSFVRPRGKTVDLLIT